MRVYIHFSTFAKGLRELIQWFLQNNCRDVCMESTEKYRIPVYIILESESKVLLTHPKQIKAVWHKNTDKRDAKLIANIFRHDLVSGRLIPPADIRKLHDWMRYRTKLTNITVGEQKHARNCEIGVDMSVFQTSKHLCFWAGLDSQNNESAGKKKPPVLVVQANTSNRFLFSEKPFLFRKGKVYRFCSSGYVIVY